MKKTIIATLAFLSVSPAFAGTVFECVGTGLSASLIELNPGQGVVPFAVLQDKLVSVSLTSDNQLKILVQSSDKSVTSASGNISTPVLYQNQNDGFFFVCGVKN